MNRNNYITFPEDCKPSFGQVLCALDPEQRVTVTVNSREKPLVEDTPVRELSLHRYYYLAECVVSGMYVGDQGVLIIGIMVGGGPR